MTRNQENSPEIKSFHKRFNIDVDFSEAQQRFINRIENRIFDQFFSSSDTLYGHELWFTMMVASAMGEKYKGRHQDFSSFVKDDFHKCLQALEAIYKYFSYPDHYISGGPEHSNRLSELVKVILFESEIDLEISWKDGQFYPTGANELDEGLVNQPLEWLQKKGYESVLAPYGKALDHLLHSIQKPELLSVVITDLYESLEALAKIFTGKENKDLSANREAFLKEIQASESYKSILKEYIIYANKFRHAAQEGTGKPELSYRETESFLYLTGLFIRMAMD